MKKIGNLFITSMLVFSLMGLSACGGGGGDSSSGTLATDTPSAPIGVTATAGDSQVIMSWTAATGATSYNIYWSTTSGVTKTNGTKISSATSPYTHTSRTNGTTYYYIVTAVNSFGESVESAQVSAAPKVVTGSPNYSGTWLQQGILLINDCNLSGLPNSVTAYPKVSQSGNNVTVVSGTVTVTGTTNDKDGFDAYSPVTTDSNGCQTMTGLSFEGASDGNAIALFAVIVQCGSQKCSAGYGGTAVRQSLVTAVPIKTQSDSTSDSLINNFVQKIFEKSLDSSKESLPLDEEGLKAAVTDAAKSAIGEITKDSTVR